MADSTLSWFDAWTDIVTRCWLPLPPWCRARCSCRHSMRFVLFQRPTTTPELSNPWQQSGWRKHSLNKNKYFCSFSSYLFIFIAQLIETLPCRHHLLLLFFSSHQWFASWFLLSQTDHLLWQSGRWWRRPSTNGPRWRADPSQGSIFAIIWIAIIDCDPNYVCNCNL